MAKKEYGTRKKYHFIYKTTNLLSKRYYIGMHSTDDLNDGYLGSGTYLKRSINKHGKENHSIEILEFVNSREELAAREREIVSLQEIAKKECMNLRVGGSGGFTDEAQKKGRISYAINYREKYETDPQFREEHKKRSIRGYEKGLKPYILAGLHHHKGFLGKTHTPETIEKMKIAAIGRGLEEANSQYGTCWITNETENKKIKKSDTIPEGWRLGRKIKF
jgi:hypothetical protein